MKRKYHWTPERDEIVRAAWRETRNYPRFTKAVTDAVRRLSVPRWEVRKRAATLGLTIRRHPWTPSDVDQLRELAGNMTITEIASRLKRSFEGVASKLNEMELSSKRMHGYSQEELAFCFGVAPVTIRKWQARAWLRLESGRITEASVKKFLRRHPEQYDLRRVDQPWFKGLIFPAADCFHAREPKAKKSVQTFAMDDLEEMEATA